MNKPKISVIMSVYNGEELLKETMDSILRQTFKDFELIVIDDCSTDSSLNILQDYAKSDERIKILHNEKNIRLQASLNRGIDAACGEFIARVDADDVMRVDRLEKQYKFMKKHSNLSMSACKFYWYIDGEIVTNPMIQRLDSASVNARLLFSNPICHPCVIMKTEVAKKMKYLVEFTCSEDLELWTRMVLNKNKIAIQRERMMLYRIHKNQITQNSSEAQAVQHRKIMSKFYKSVLFELSNDELDFLTRGIYFLEEPDLNKLTAFLKKVQDKNRELNTFTSNSLKYASFEVLSQYRRKGINVTKQLLNLGVWFLALEFIIRTFENLYERIMRKNTLVKFAKAMKRGDLL